MEGCDSSKEDTTGGLVVHVGATAVAGGVVRIGLAMALVVVVVIPVVVG